MKKSFFYSVLTLTFLLICAQTPSVEARGHHHSRTNVQVNVGNAYGYRDAYVTQRYVRPMPVMYAQPVAVPYYYAPGPAYVPVQTYAYAPAYVEEVYVAPVRRPSPVNLGLSFSWNLFR